MTEANIPVRDMEKLNKTIRIEIRCKRKKIKRLRKLFDTRGLRDFFSNSDEICDYIFDKYSNIFYGKGDFYKLKDIKPLIDATNYKKKTKDRMNELAKLSSIRCNLSVALKEFEKRYGKNITLHILRKFDEISVSPVIVPKRSKFDKFDNPHRLSKDWMNNIN